MDNSDIEEKTIIDLAKDILKIWPFSVLFPEEVKVTRDKVDNGKEDDDGVFVEEPDQRIIGQNIDRGIDQGLGLLHFILKYEVEFEKLKIILLQANNLVGKDPRGTSDPYAVITFDPKFRNDGYYKTEAKKKTLNPIWNHVFVFQNFTHDDLDRHRVHITLYDWDKYGDHEALGEIYYDLIKLHGKNHGSSSKHDEISLATDQESVSMGSKSIVDWIDTTNPTYEIEEPWKPLVSITDEDEKLVEKSASMIFNSNFDYEDEIEEEDEENNEKTLTNEVKVNIIRKIEIRKNLQALPNSRSVYGQILISLDYSIRTRELVVNIIKAKDMIDPAKRALIPYCCLRHLFISNDREKTRSIHHTSYRFYTETPVWNEAFPLKVAPDKLKQTALEIEVFHSTSESKPSDEKLGLIRLGLKTYPAQKEHYVEFLSNIGRPIARWHHIRI